MELYRAFTIRENYKNRDSVVVDWFCESRQRPVARIEDLVESLPEMDDKERAELQARLDQLLTTAEVDELARYIRATTGFEVKRTRIELPVSDAKKIPDFSGKSSVQEGEYFHIHESRDYNLSALITGYVDLSEPPNTVSMG